MSRSLPDQWSPLRLPQRTLRIARTATCPHCSEQVATRDGKIAGHYYGKPGTTICPGANRPAPEELPQ